MLKNLLRLWRFVPSRHQRQVLALMILSILSSLVEAVAVGSILPFIAVLQDPELIKAYLPGRMLHEWLGTSLALGVTFIFCISVLMSCAMRVLLVWASSRVSQGVSSALGGEIFRRTMYQPYSVFVTRSSTEIVDLLSIGVEELNADCLLPSLNLISSVFVIAAVGVLLVLVDPVVATTVVLGIGSLYALIARMNRHRLKRLGFQSSTAKREKIRIIQEGMGGMRDVLINATQPFYCRIFGDTDIVLNRSRTSVRVLGQFPRHLIEAVALVLVATLAYRMSDGSNLSSSIAVLGTFAIGAQRTLPALQNAFASWAAIRSSYVYVIRVLKYLDESGPAPDANARRVHPMPFHDSIQLNHVCFRYSKSQQLALDEVSLMIPRGSRVGIIGTSGSGKSTLADILMGLLVPSEGDLVVDGTAVSAMNRAAWQANISHVPQAVFISEGSIEDNIALGISAKQIDPIRVREAARMAQIHDFIESLPAGYATQAGERGIRLSGGQRQRIGIARALYRRCEVLVLDEATSALDSETEQSVMQAVNQLSKELTIILIAHRLTTLRDCDYIIQIANGKLECQGSYTELINGKI